MGVGGDSTGYGTFQGSRKQGRGAWGRVEEAAGMWGDPRTGETRACPQAAVKSRDGGEAEARRGCGQWTEGGHE